MEDIKRLKIVVLRCPYDNFDQEFVKELFPKIAQLKIRGYQKEYPYGVLPFDASDFVATHVLLCEGRNGLVPIMGFKSVTLERCDLHKINFPILGMLKSKDETSAHQQAVLRLADTHRKNGTSHQFAYNGSYTIDPDYRPSEEMKKTIWEITTTLLVKYYEEYQINHVIAVCSTTFKIDRYKRYLGWKNFNDIFGNELAPYGCSSLDEAPFKVMHVTSVSDQARADADKHRHLWNSRITISDFDYSNKIKKAA